MILTPFFRPAPTAVYRARDGAIISRMRTIRSWCDRAYSRAPRTLAAPWAVLATWVLFMIPAPAHAETTTSPPTPGVPWLEWLLVFAFVGLCCAIAFKNPKRSHLA